MLVRVDSSWRRATRSPRSARPATRRPRTCTSRSAATARRAIRWATCSDAADAGDGCAALIRDVPDFPSPGIVFKDITPLLQDRRGASAAPASCWPRRSADGDRPRGGHRVARLHLRHARRAALGAGFAIARKPGKLPSADRCARATRSSTATRRSRSTRCARRRASACS